MLTYIPQSSQMCKLARVESESSLKQEPIKTIRNLDKMLDTNYQKFLEEKINK